MLIYYSIKLYLLAFYMKHSPIFVTRDVGTYKSQVLFYVA